MYISILLHPLIVASLSKYLIPNANTRIYNKSSFLPKDYIELQLELDEYGAKEVFGSIISAICWLGRKTTTTKQTTTKKQHGINGLKSEPT